LPDIRGKVTKTAKPQTKRYDRIQKCYKIEICEREFPCLLFTLSAECRRVV